MVKKFMYSGTSIWPPEGQATRRPGKSGCINTEGGQIKGVLLKENDCMGLKGLHHNEFAVLGQFCAYFNS